MGSFEVYDLSKAADITKAVVLTWELPDGKTGSEARLVATAQQGPDLKDGAVETSGCVSLRSPHPQVICLGAI